MNRGRLSSPAYIQTQSGASSTSPIARNILDARLAGGAARNGPRRWCRFSGGAFAAPHPRLKHRMLISGNGIAATRISYKPQKLQAKSAMVKVACGGGGTVGKRPRERGRHAGFASWTGRDIGPWKKRGGGRSARKVRLRGRKAPARTAGLDCCPAAPAGLQASGMTWACSQILP